MEDDVDDGERKENEGEKLLDDFSWTGAGGAAEGSSLEALLGVGVAQPGRPRVSQLRTVAPDIIPFEQKAIITNLIKVHTKFLWYSMRDIKQV